MGTLYDIVESTEKYEMTKLTELWSLLHDAALPPPLPLPQNTTISFINQIINHTNELALDPAAVKDDCRRFMTYKLLGDVASVCQSLRAIAYIEYLTMTNTMLYVCTNNLKSLIKVKVAVCLYEKQKIDAKLLLEALKVCVQIKDSHLLNNLCRTMKSAYENNEQMIFYCSPSLGTVSSILRFVAWTESLFEARFNLNQTTLIKCEVGSIEEEAIEYHSNSNDVIEKLIINMSATDVDADLQQAFESIQEYEKYVRSQDLERSRVS